MAIGTLPPELFAEQQQLNRQQQMAQALMQQGQQQPQGQMVSGRYVAPSFFQNILPLAQMYAGNRLAEKGDERALALAAKLRQRQGEDVKSYMQAMTPTTTEMAGPYGVSGAGQNVPMPTATQGPDYAKAFQVAYNSYDPALRAQAMDMIKTQKLGEGETLNRFDFSTGQLTPFAQGGSKLATGVKEAAQLLGINKPVEQWSQQELAAVNQKAMEIKRAAGTTVNIPNFAEKTFAGGLAESQVKKFDTLQTNAEKAPDVLRSAAESKKILKSGKFFSGSPAELQLEMAKVADALGLGGTDTKEKAFNTQTLITNAASGTLDSIAGAGLGTGQGFTDKDLKFLQEAKSFRINMTDDNIRRVIDLQERAARASVDRYNQRLRTLPQQSIQQMGLTPITLPRSADEIVGNQ
jgi:hypothetical protein